MTDEQIEKALKLAISGLSECAQEQILGYVNHLKEESASKELAYNKEYNLRKDLQRERAEEKEALMKEADENAALAMEQKLRADKLETKLQANLEKAYDHNTEECKRCMEKVEFKQRCAEDAVIEQIRKETAKEILNYILHSSAPYTADIEVLKEKYGVEVDE